MENKKLKGFNPNEIILNDYRIIKKIATGGMNSIIYIAECINIDPKDFLGQSDKCVAIKLINRTPETTDNAWNRFYQECITSLRISNCENIIKTKKCTRTLDNNSIVIVMEYFENISLRQLISEKGKLSLKESLFYFMKMLIAIKGLHSFNQKIIHRDLKPENILVSKDRSVLKIIDFGISTVVRTNISNFIEKKEKKIMTNEDEVYGTYAYLSPDLLQLFGNNELEKKINILSEQCDFYSLGVIFFEMLTGNKPFVAENYSDSKIINLPLKYDIPPLSKTYQNIPVHVENIIFRCMASKPEDLKFRYNNIDDIIDDLEKLKTNFSNARKEILLKSVESRILQTNIIFDISKVKRNLKFFSTQWFFLVMSWLTLMIIIIIVIFIMFDIFI